MNPIPHRYQTLGELRRRLRARLGFMTQGPAAESNRAALDDMLQEAHAYVCAQVQVSVLRKKTTIALEPGSYRYDWHNDSEDEDIDPGRVLSVWIAASDGLRVPLVQGIGERHREQADLRATPSRYDTLDGQVELWPIPDRTCDLLIEYEASLTRFTRDADRPGVPDALVFRRITAMPMRRSQAKNSRPCCANTRPRNTRAAATSPVNAGKPVCMWFAPPTVISWGVDRDERQGHYV